MGQKFTLWEQEKSEVAEEKEKRMYGITYR